MKFYQYKAYARKSDEKKDEDAFRGYIHAKDPEEAIRKVEKNYKDIDWRIYSVRLIELSYLN